PFARDVLSGGSGLDLRTVAQQAGSFAMTVARLPRRMDEIIERLDRGQVAVRVPDVERGLRSLQRTIGRLVSAIVFAALL
ncbi:hypothetical protein, partial [Mesorhizobium japonicum]|uniref:hypothetical protein n=1 Tax=Mesorhizobium japonicum TaxID=2066070 RepID=UPI003B5C774F